MKVLRMTLIALTVLLSGSLLAAFLFSGEAIQADEETIIRFGHGSEESNERHLAVMHFKELVEEKSGGNIEVRVYPNEQLGSEAEMTESVTLNDLQMVAGSAFSQYDENISVFELPYLFESYEEAWQVLDGEAGREAAEPLLEDNLRVLAYFENGFRHVTANKPIDSPDDLRGVKIRTPEFPISLRTFNALGANPTPMAFGELYTALQQGTVDAQENPVANTYSSNFQEVQTHMSMTSHQYLPLPVAINDDFWNELNAEEKLIVEESTQEAAQYHRDLIVENEEKSLDALQEEGMEIVYPDTEPFEENAKIVHENFRNNYGDQLLDKVLADAKKE